MNIGRIEVPFGAQNVIIETGKIAKQANAAVTVTLGGTTVLVTVCMSKSMRDGIDFFPLMVEYQEKTYAAGKIPGGFFKREGRPTQKEILTCRLIDRPIRPLFPEGFYNDVIVSCTVLSADKVNDPDILAILGASAVLSISNIPFNGPVGVCRVARVDGEFVVNPTFEQRENADMEIVVVGGEDGVSMIEGEAKEVPEEEVVKALKFAQEQLQASRLAQVEFKSQVGQEKLDVAVFNPHPDLKAKVSGLVKSRLEDAYRIADKLERDNLLGDIHKELISDMSVYDEFKVDDREVTAGNIFSIYDEIQYDVVRNMIFTEQKRADGRSPKEIRELKSEIDILQCAHGSALFTRGQTQSLGVVTLGTKRDEQMIESLEGVHYNRFMLHYNFPPFSVGEARPSRGAGRREIGHGALAAKALKSVLPSKEDFPYTIRIVSEILESNGSSSMASVCSGTLSLMAAGVPIKNPVAGISVGLITGDNPDQYYLISDIMGMEDHFGDMDYKVAGSKQGVTAIQLDIKLDSIPVKILAEGIMQSKEARDAILENMTATIAEPKEDVSATAPRIVSTSVPVEKIGEVIGPGGKVIKKIMEETGAESIDIDDDGTVLVSAMNKESADAAIAYVNGIVEVPIVGKIYDAKVVKVMNFGAFCEFLPGKQGLVHVSELADEYVKDVETVVKVGDQFKVKLTEIDKMNRMNLSKKQAEPKVETTEESAE